ncbi:hypothetical protein WN51_05422 [Melipona quadrifasciata]|uniref:Uncharacterized protein n=1 Tax=Melipona quadrifasciata TaxID=166423 RepID=A0A0M8ZSM0_9HYME|nr:hypothetical protein WN51_05422 [Melipona quadrifasciata]
MLISKKCFKCELKAQKPRQQSLVNVFREQNFPEVVTLQRDTMKALSVTQRSRATATATATTTTTTTTTALADKVSFRASLVQRVARAPKELDGAANAPYRPGRSDYGLTALNAESLLSKLRREETMVPMWRMVSLIENR